MSPKMLALIGALISAALIAACGTVADPVFKITPQVEVVQAGAGTTVAIVPTATQLPTATPVPSTATPAPTLAPTAEATAAPTEAVSSAVVIGSAEYGATDPKKFLVDSFGDATRGEALFAQTFVVDEIEWACSTCHNVVGDEEKIGPSQWNVGEHALTRVEGEGPYTYLYNSIYNSQLYIVPGYEDKTHMPIFGENNILTDSQIYDLVRYLLTLHA